MARAVTKKAAATVRQRAEKRKSCLREEFFNLFIPFGRAEAGRDLRGQEDCASQRKASCNISIGMEPHVRERRMYVTPSALAARGMVLKPRLPSYLSTGPVELTGPSVVAQAITGDAGTSWAASNCLDVERDLIH